MIIKAEIHCHIEGAAHPDLANRLARKHGISLDGVVEDNRYVWDDFTTFLNCYDRASSVFRTAEDYRLLAYDVMRRMAEDGAIYGEVFTSSDHAAAQGLAYDDMIEAVDAGMADAEADFGIVGRCIATCVRHLGPEAAEAVARLIVSNPHPRVTGFGMGGDERAFAPEDFAPAYAIAGDAGLGLTAHAGEFAGPQSVTDCLDHLGVTRIGHGVRSIEDPALVERLAEDGIVLEVCPGSNISLGVYPDQAAHPLRKLFDAGVPVTLSSDDPPYFDTTLAAEYEIAARDHGFSEDELLACTRVALEAAFVDEPTRRRLLERLDD
ncbi:MAG: adenosine deaminase [Pseudomonadota bacterium]